MASSSTKKRKSKLAFDTKKFVSEEAQNRYHDSVVKRNPIAERGLCVTGVNWLSIQNNFRAENGMNFVINQRQLLFLLFENFMPMLLNITIGKFLLKEKGLVLVEEQSTNFSKYLIWIGMNILLLLGGR